MDDTICAICFDKHYHAPTEKLREIEKILEGEISENAKLSLKDSLRIAHAFQRDGVKKCVKGQTCFTIEKRNETFSNLAAAIAQKISAYINSGGDISDILYHCEMAFPSAYREIKKIAAKAEI